MGERMVNLKQYFRTIAIITYLVDKLQGISPQVGKTVIQKMMYFLDFKGLGDFNFKLYHYGPYSSIVEGELNYAAYLGAIEIQWLDNQGYSIRPREKAKRYEELLTDDEESIIDDVINTFGRYNAKELALIATILYFRKTLDDESTVKAVKSIKPQFSEGEIKEKLEIVKKYFHL